MGRSRRGATGGSKKRDSSFIHRGSEGRERAVDEVKKSNVRREQASKGKVFRFFVPVGETKQFIILDEKDDCYLYEHTIPDPHTGKWTNHITCPKENDSCAACAEYGESPYVLFFSVIDLTPFKDSKGVKHPASRKLMAVKQSQQKKFIRLLDRKGTLRGAVFETSRDGPKDAAIGNDIEFLEFAKEKELKKDYMREWTDRKDKVHVENMGEPFNYEELFEKPDADKIRAMLGVEPPMGSKGQQDRDMNSSDDDWDKDDDEPWDKDDSKKKNKDKKKKGGKKSKRSDMRRGRKDKSSDSTSRRSRRTR